MVVALAGLYYLIPLWSMPAISGYEGWFADDAERIYQAVLKINATVHNQSYRIWELWWPGKDGDLSANLTAYRKFIKLMATRSALNVSIDVRPVGWLRGSDFEYLFNYSADRLYVRGNFTSVDLAFLSSSTALMGGNCSGSGLPITVRSNEAVYNTAADSNCSIWLNYSGTFLYIDYDGNFTIDYGAIGFDIINNFTINTTSPSAVHFGGAVTEGDTSSTTNPGWTEPTYPPGSSEVRHYGTIDFRERTCNLIVVDYDNDTTYELAYIDSDADGEFNDSTDLCALNGSHIYLNDAVIFLTVDADGNVVRFENVAGIWLRKNYEVVRGFGPHRIEG